MILTTTPSPSKFSTIHFCFSRNYSLKVRTQETGLSDNLKISILRQLGRQSQEVCQKPLKIKEYKHGAKSRILVVKKNAKRISLIFFFA